jgi:hypothetical protein
VYTRRLLTAVLVSLAAHALVMAGAWMPLPAPPDTPSVILAQLVEQPAPPPAVRRHPVPAAAPAHRAPRTAPPPETLIAPEGHYAMPIMPAEPAGSESPAALSGESPPDPTPSSSDAEATEVASPAEPPPQQGLPSQAQLIYTLYLGTDQVPVGRSVFRWKLEQDSYKLVSDAETTGIVEVFRPQRLTYTSEGKLTRDGLQPTVFTMTRLRRGKTDAAQARLDWASGRMTYGRPTDPRTVELPVPSQDIASFLLQLALHPPTAGRIRLPITNGLRFETYEIEVLAEERIETPMGLFNALPLRQMRKSGSESIALWLAVDYYYLPVRVRFYDRDGKPSGEQLIQEIRVEPK